MKLGKYCPDIHQIKALLCKDFLIRWRLWWMTAVQLIWPCLVFMLLYLIRLKFGPQFKDDCQFPTRQLPTKNNVLQSFYSTICTLENKCLSTQHYEEYTKFDNAAMKPVIDIVQLFINDKGLYNAIIDLPVKHNFINAVTTVVTGGHMDEIRVNVQKVIDLVPQIEVYLNGSFDIKKMFSDRATFVKSGYLLCGQPFPNTDTIPLVNDILYSDDFSEVNDEELKVMPTKYCKKLYLDVTSTNQGKLTWNVIKPIIHGKILFAPDTPETRSIMQFSNTTFEELGKLKNLSIALEQIFLKLREDDAFQKALNNLLVLADSPFIRSLIGNEFNIDDIKAVIERMRTDPVIYDVINTIKNILECLSVDRFVGTDNEQELRSTAFELNKQRLFYAAVNFVDTQQDNVVYKLHMDTDKTQPTFENKNRFWFPGPNGNMLMDMKYHRGFVQIKQTLDLGIIKHKKNQLHELGLLTVAPTTTASPIKVDILTDDDLDFAEDDDDWFLSESDVTNSTKNDVKNSTSTSNLISGLFNGLFDFRSMNPENNDTETTTESATTILPTETYDYDVETETEAETETVAPSLSRVKRQGLLDLLNSFATASVEKEYQVDKLQYYTKQFPYPAYIHDDFKTGLYLGQAIQVGFFLGLVAQVLSCVRHRIWMRESKNSMMMRCMGLKPASEMIAWVIVSLIELVIIFTCVLFILYFDGILVYSSWFFLGFYMLVFGACLISFCYMCSTFFISATIGAVATSIIFFISFCPYILVLLFDASLNAWQNFGINLFFTTAFAHGWNHIMRMEVQQRGFSFQMLSDQGLEGECGFSIFMMVLDLFIYILIGQIVQRCKNDENQFIELERGKLDSNIGARLTKVSKVYNDSKVAADQIDLVLPRNQVTCLLGRNGAGKSTVIKMLTGQVEQTSGKVELAKTSQDSMDYDRVGLCAQGNILIPELTAREHLELYGKIKSRKNYMEEVEKTLKSLNFNHYENYQVSSLSGGYQRRLCVAIAFLCSPNVVILDEPCNCVDIRARKDIWDLVKSLQRNRAVVLATHFLDEAEYLSDNIIIMKKGRIIATHTPDTLTQYSTQRFELSLKCPDQQTYLNVRNMIGQMLHDYQVLDEKVLHKYRFEIAYKQKSQNTAEFFEYLENLQQKNQISELKVKGKNLEHLFKNIDSEMDVQMNGNYHLNSAIESKQEHAVSNKSLSNTEMMRKLLWKRFKHFSRNYRILLAVLLLPAIFELIAMWFVACRVEDDYDKSLRLSRDLYPNTMQFLSKDSSTNSFVNNVYEDLALECTEETPCRIFNNSETLFYWLLNTTQDYLENRYGGYSFNDTKTMLWYNNKGYHAMISWLNDFNTYLMRTELNDTSYSISTYNEPWKLEFTELSTTSMLRQIGDSCMAFVLLIAFSLIVAVAVVYLVNERIKGEKLQQRLCGVKVSTYWLVAFIWDYLILIVGLIICTIIILCFNMPVFVGRQQLWGFIVLVLFYGFAAIPAIHVFEKCFSDASVAIVTVFSMNVIIPMFTMAIIVLIGVIGDSENWDEWRFFLNRAFLIFPQHALGDGLLELCKNYMVALTFLRYDIDSYKHPLSSDLLRPHFIALVVVGLFFILLNTCLELGVFYRWVETLKDDRWHKKERSDELKAISICSIQNTLTRDQNKISNMPALEVDNLCKSFTRKEMVLRNVCFEVKPAECVGLLGRNGAGKSTIFKILSGQMQPTSGTVSFSNKEVSYCPQTNTLDDLLTVQECLEFYAYLRRIKDIPKFVQCMLESFQLEPQVLVKNLSGGNRRKLTVATTCCGQTPLVLMDEPTSDMDPMTRAVVYRVIHELLAEGRAVVLTSHTISEIDDICDRIIVLKEGQLLLSSDPVQLKQEYGSFYSVSLYSEPQKMAQIVQKVHQHFPQNVNLTALPNSVTFRIKLRSMPQIEKTRQQNDTKLELTLTELFQSLKRFVDEFDGPLCYMINHCRLDAIFENVLESNPSQNRYKSSQKTALLNGNSNSSAYTHSAYVETETAT